MYTFSKGQGCSTSHLRLVCHLCICNVLFFILFFQKKLLVLLISVDWGLKCFDFLRANLCKTHILKHFFTFVFYPLNLEVVFFLFKKVTDFNLIKPIPSVFFEEYSISAIFKNALPKSRSQNSTPLFYSRILIKFIYVIQYICTYVYNYMCNIIYTVYIALLYIIHIYVIYVHIYNG